MADFGAIGSAKTDLQTPAGPFSQNRLLLSLTPSSAVMNHSRRACAAGSSAEGSPRACRRLRLSSAGFAIQLNSDPRSGGLQICNNKRRHQITLKRQRQPCRNTEGSRGGVGLRQYRVARWFLLPEADSAAAAFCVSKILRRAGARRALRGTPRSACQATVVHDS